LAVHRSKYRVGGMGGNKNWVATGGLISDHDPFRLPAPVTLTNKRVPHRVYGIPRLSLRDFACRKQMNASDSVVN
jgi:hypothetical protein